MIVMCVSDWQLLPPSTMGENGGTKLQRVAYHISLTKYLFWSLIKILNNKLVPQNLKIYR